jgi:cytochrome c
LGRAELKAGLQYGRQFAVLRAANEEVFMIGMRNGANIGIVMAWALCAAAPVQAGGNAAHGKAVFQQNCAVCHTAQKGGSDGVGPDLFGIVGRKPASRPNFFYSPAMKQAGFSWDNAKLDAYVQNPQKLVPGNRMAFAGVRNPADAADLVAYLDTLK